MIKQFFNLINEDDLLSRVSNRPYFEESFNQWQRKGVVFLEIVFEAKLELGVES